MRNKVLKFVFFFLCIANNLLAQSNVLATGSDQDPMLYVLDTNNFNVAGQLHLEGNSGEMFEGAYGLARDNSGNYYSSFVYSSGVNVLGKININTGKVVVVDTLSQQFSGLSFANNKLWGVTDESATSSQTLYTINPSNAILTFIHKLNYQDQGAAIGYCNTNQQLYSWAGDSLYKINPVTNAVSLIGYDTNGVLSVTNPFYPQSMLYIGNGNFLISGYYDNGDFWIADTSGKITASGKSYDNSIHNVKGWVYVDQGHASIQGLATFCDKDSIGLAHASLIGDNYQWTLNGNNILGATGRTYLPSMAGTYNCWVNVNGDVDTASSGLFVIIKPLPVVILTGDTFVCEGKSIVITGAMGGIGSQWFENGVDIPGATQNTFTVSAAGIYNQLKTDVNGCKDSAAMGIKVMEAPAPSLTVISDNPSICIGASTVIRAFGTHVYSWSTGATGDTLLVQPLIPTTYSVVAMDTITGCTEPYAELISVIIPEVNITSDKFALCTGDSTVLKATGAAAYEWAGGIMDDTLTVMPGITTTYSVVGTDVMGCMDTASYELLVHNAVPVISVSMSDTICAGTSATLTANGTHVVTYLWSTAETVSSITVMPAMQTTYSVVAANGCGKDTAFVQIDLYSLPVITFSLNMPNDTLCNSASSFSLNGSPAGGSFVGTGVTGNVFNPANANVGWNIITYSYTDVNGCTNDSPMDSVYVLNCSGVLEGNKSKFEMYPNPANGFVTINSTEQINNIIVFNSIGEVVYHTWENQKQIRIDLNSFASGIYFVRVNNAVLKLLKE